MDRKKIYHLLARGETLDAEAPYSCLPPGDKIWLSLKTTRIIDLFEEIRQQLWAALEQSRKGEPIDLPEEWFELFSAIQNDGIGKAEEIRELREELKVGNALLAKLTDRCRELEAQQTRARMSSLLYKLRHWLIWKVLGPYGKKR